MGRHKNAKLTARGRVEMVHRVMAGGESPKAVATAFGLSPRIVRKWVARYREQGEVGLEDRSSRPHHLRAQTAAAVVEQIEQMRRQRWTQLRIARATGLAKSSVNRYLAKAGLRRLPSLEPPVAVVRYERSSPGDLLHLDTKKLGRIERASHRVTGNRRDRVKGAGWEYVHVCIDDHTRVAFAQIRPDERRDSAAAFLDDAVAYYRSLGVVALEVMTDNGSCYRSACFRKACTSHGLRHIFTRPYTPRTNGKAERFIQSSLREWAYAEKYSHSDLRTQALQGWLDDYNWHRPHHSLNLLPPVSRLPQTGNNLLSHHT
jgi:transposase InsO family protein